MSDISKSENKRYMSVYNDIIHRIKNGFLKPGDKLPPEPELAAQYGVSRVTVGHALKMLENINLIYRIKKSGTFVNGKRNSSSVQRIVPIILPFEESFNYQLIEGAQNYALLNNCFTPFFNSNNSTRREQEILSNILKMNIDGLICYPCSLFDNMDLFAQYKIKGIPLVFLDRTSEGIKAPLVTCNNEKGMFDVVENLIKRGHREIGYFLLDEYMFFPERERFNGYMEAMIKHRLPVHNKYIFRSERSRENDMTNSESYRNFLKLTYSVGQKLAQMEHLPSAICCVNDVSAATLLQVFNELNVPRLKSIIVTGFDNMRHIPISVQQDFHELGKTVVMTMLNILEGISVPDVYHTGVTLIDRMSDAC